MEDMQRGARMRATKEELATRGNTVEISDIAKLEFYRLIGEGYKAMQEDRTSTIDEVPYYRNIANEGVNVIA